MMLESDKRRIEAIDAAVKSDARVMEEMIHWGLSVMLHGRPRAQANAAGTRRWVVEIEMYPICIIEEWDGDDREALRRAWVRFKAELLRQGS